MQRYQTINPTVPTDDFSWYQLTIIHCSLLIYYTAIYMFTAIYVTMGEDRLTGLALLHVNKSTEVDPDDVIQLYASKKDRRIRLI